jgi:hypothetical protein
MPVHIGRYKVSLSGSFGLRLSWRVENKRRRGEGKVGMRSAALSGLARFPDSRITACALLRPGLLVCTACVPCAEQVCWYVLPVPRTEQICWYVLPVPRTEQVCWYVLPVSHAEQVCWYVLLMPRAEQVCWYVPPVPCAEQVCWYALLMPCTEQGFGMYRLCLTRGRIFGMYHLCLVQSKYVGMYQCTVWCKWDKLMTREFPNMMVGQTSVVLVCP